MRPPPDTNSPDGGSVPNSKDVWAHGPARGPLRAHAQKQATRRPHGTQHSRLAPTRTLDREGRPRVHGTPRRATRCHTHALRGPSGDAVCVSPTGRPRDPRARPGRGRLSTAGPGPWGPRKRPCERAAGGHSERVPARGARPDWRAPRWTQRHLHQAWSHGPAQGLRPAQASRVPVTHASQDSPITAPSRARHRAAM